MIPSAILRDELTLTARAGSNEYGEAVAGGSQVVAARCFTVTRKVAGQDGKTQTATLRALVRPDVVVAVGDAATFDNAAYTVLSVEKISEAFGGAFALALNLGGA